MVLLLLLLLGFAFRLLRGIPRGAVCLPSVSFGQNHRNQVCSDKCWSCGRTMVTTLTASSAATRALAQHRRVQLATSACGCRPEQDWGLI